MSVFKAQLLFIVLFPLTGFSQSFDKDIIIPVNSIDWKTNMDNQLTRHLMKKDIIVLAESDHGYGSSFDAQCMIMKKLIDSSNFITLFLEASWITCDKIMEVLKQGKENSVLEAEQYIESVDLKYWVKNGFLEYLAQKILENRVEIKGIDIDGISSVLMDQLFKEAIGFPQIQNYMRQNPKDSAELSWHFNDIDGYGSSSNLLKENMDVIQKFYKRGIKSI